MKILGIDPGTAITGWGYVQNESSNKFKNIQYGTITTPAKSSLASRLQTIYEDLEQLIDQLQPEAVAIEKLFFNTNAKTAMSVGHARGIIMLVPTLKNIPVYEYTPLQIKQGITGYGRANKKQVQAMVTTLLKLNNIPKPDDAADGLACAVTHAFNKSMQLVNN